MTNTNNTAATVRLTAVDFIVEDCRAVLVDGGYHFAKVRDAKNFVNDLKAHGVVASREFGSLVVRFTR